MQKRRCIRSGAEIPSYSIPHIKVCNEEGGVQRTYGKVLQLRRQHQQPGENGDNQKYRKTGRCQADNTALVETPKRKATGLQLCQNNPCDQIARDHKKHIHPNKAAAEAGQIQVVENNQHYGNTTEAVYFRAVCHAHLYISVSTSSGEANGSALRKGRPKAALSQSEVYVSFHPTKTRACGQAANGLERKV